MKKAERECVDCSKVYDPNAPNKPGRINQCAECGAKVEVERVKGVTTYDDKTDRYLTIVSEKDFDELKRSRRSASGLYQGW
jgi:DNA-directed RNA polymerase subunit RPC12/RpoP